MALITHTKPIVVGDQVYRTRSGIVDTATVKRGMVLKRGAGGQNYVQPATASAKVLGVAIGDYAIGERATYIIPPCDIRVMLSESETIHVDDWIQSATIAIAGVTTPGHVKEIAPPTAPGVGYVQADAATATDFILYKIGFALEAVSTGADEAKLLKIRFTGN